MSKNMRTEHMEKKGYRTEETRESILAVAEELVTERGLFDTQMIDVAETAGVSRTTLYRYFGDKYELAFAILTRIMAEMFRSRSMAAAACTSRGVERIAEFIKASWLSPKFTRHVRYLSEFDAYYSGSRLPADFREKMLKAISGSYLPEFVIILQEGIAEGSVRPDINPHLTAVTVLNAIRGLQQRLLLRGNVLVELEQGESDLMMNELMDYLLRGIRA